jgi:hypothetical protein
MRLVPLVLVWQQGGGSLVASLPQTENSSVGLGVTLVTCCSERPGTEGTNIETLVNCLFVRISSDCL